MSCNKENKKVYTKDEIVKIVSKDCGVDRKTVRRTYDSIEGNIFSLLSSADADHDVLLRLFEGVSFEGNYVPEHDAVNNLTGEGIVVDGRVKPKVNITRSYKEKLNA